MIQCVVGNFLDWCLNFGILFYHHSTNSPFFSLWVTTVHAVHSVTVGGCTGPRGKRKRAVDYYRLRADSFLHNAGIWPQWLDFGSASSLNLQGSLADHSQWTRGCQKRGRNLKCEYRREKKKGGGGGKRRLELLLLWCLHGEDDGIGSRQSFGGRSRGWWGMGQVLVCW